MNANVDKRLSKINGCVITEYKYIYLCVFQQTALVDIPGMIVFSVDTASSWP